MRLLCGWGIYQIWPLTPTRPAQTLRESLENFTGLLEVTLRLWKLENAPKMLENTLKNVFLSDFGWKIDFWSFFGDFHRNMACKVEKHIQNITGMAFECVYDDYKTNLESWFWLPKSIFWIGNPLFNVKIAWNPY